MRTWIVDRIQFASLGRILQGDRDSRRLVGQSNPTYFAFVCETGLPFEIRFSSQVFSMKRFSFLAFSVMAVMVAGAIGCNKSDSSATGNGSADGAKKLVIAAIPKSIGGEFWETVEQGGLLAQLFPRIHRLYFSESLR